MADTQAPDSIMEFRLVHSGFSRFGVASVRLSDGAVVKREIEDHGAAAAVLPYDPERRVALLVEQFRPAVLHAGGAPRLLEAPAGLLGKETPEDCARREAFEEAGIELQHLELVAASYAMPGISTERLSLFLAEYQHGHRTAAGGGLASENEVLTVVEMTLAELARMADEAELADLKTLTLVLALRVRRPDLFR